MLEFRGSTMLEIKGVAFGGRASAMFAYATAAMVSAGLLGAAHQALAQAGAPRLTPEQLARVQAQNAKPRPELLFRETWRQPPYQGQLTDENRRVTQAAVGNPDLQLHVYGTDARSVTVYSHESRLDLWTGLVTSPVAVTLSDKRGDFNLSGLARLRGILRTQGLHVLHPVVKLADGTLIAGSQTLSTEGGTYLEEEVAFDSQNNPHWFRLDPDKMVTMNELKNPDLSRVQEVGYVDLAPAGGHGVAGYVNISAVELNATMAPRD